MADAAASITVRVVEGEVDFDRAFPVMVQLRPHLTAASFRERARRQMADGWRLAVAERGEEVVGVAGFRISETLVSGRHLYVDDLVTDAGARSAGVARALLSWLADHAAASGCRRLELDSGVQRDAAHRFYFRERMSIASYHFRKEIQPKTPSEG